MTPEEFMQEDGDIPTCEEMGRIGKKIC